MDKKTTQLHSFHKSNNAKFIDFGDWSMPFSYEGTLKEHDIVRNSSGFFDVSHMGRLEINYSNRLQFISYIAECNYTIFTPNFFIVSI